MTFFFGRESPKTDFYHLTFFHLQCKRIQMPLICNWWGQQWRCRRMITFLRNKWGRCQCLKWNHLHESIPKTSRMCTVSSWGMGVSVHGVSTYGGVCLRGVHYRPPDRILDTRLWKHYLSATTVADGNKNKFGSMRGEYFFALHIS